jgi:peptidoglycan/xylan/chitin deacetylase (PgdA/CDA1 family)
LENAFTVDVEEWFHICGVGGAFREENWTELPSRVVETTDGLLELLDRRDVLATFFVLGWVANRYPHLVARIRSAGHEVASHGYSHRRVYELRPQEFADRPQFRRCLLRARNRSSGIALRSGRSTTARCGRSNSWPAAGSSTIRA